MSIPSAMEDSTKQYRAAFGKELTPRPEEAACRTVFKIHPCMQSQQHAFC